VKPTEGIFPGISREHYDSIQAINQSILKVAIQKSPAHARQEDLHPGKTTAAKLFGQAVHELVLEPQKFLSNWCSPAMNADGIRYKKTTKEGKAEWAAWEEKNAGKTILDIQEMPHAWKKAHQIQRALMAQKASRQILVGRGLNECALVWQDSDTELWCKALIDRIELDREPCTHLWDLKSAAHCQPRRFAYQAADLGYHFQAGFYMMGAFALEPVERRFGFLTFEKEEPFVAKAFLCAASVIDQGQYEAKHALRLWDRCLQQDRWPAYGDAIDEFHLPEWAYREIQ